MQSQNPQEALTQADALAQNTQRSARWLVRYYLAFGVASVLMSVGVGLLQGGVWLAVLMVIWFGLIVAISIYAARQQTMVRGGGRIHAGVMIAWTVFWVITVSIGASNDLPWPWWLAGGLGMLAACLGGAWVVARRTEGATRGVS
ncbi:MAG TPA: hypothetical protein VM429_11910 [Micropruina sp.]|nr:hypothetical protein [Micropruina sp.]